MGAYLQELFGLDGKVALVTGGTGALGSAIARGLARAGAGVGILGRREARARELADEIVDAGGAAAPLRADVLRRDQLEAARDALVERLGPIDILVNAAGGNTPEATLGEGEDVFDLPADVLRRVIDLNLLGTILPCQAVGAQMAQRGSGSIINISSLASGRALTRVVGYGVAKAGVEQLTRWLAAELARKYGEGLRVNAVVPGFFLGDQNRTLLVNLDGSLTQRGSAILERTPAGRFGHHEEVVGTVIWLCSPAASFINGAIVPVDGGFSAFSGI